jgi:ABC-type branched-subunit amino acid transport system ATPase component
MPAPTDDTSKPLIRVDHLVKRYGDLAAVDDISDQTEPGRRRRSRC